MPHEIMPFLAFPLSSSSSSVSAILAVDGFNGAVLSLRSLMVSGRDQQFVKVYNLVLQCSIASTCTWTLRSVLCIDIVYRMILVVHTT